MSILTNVERTYLVKAFINQPDLVLCIGKPTPWESTHAGSSDLTPPVESADLTEVIEPIVYKTINQLRFAKLDPSGTVNYRGSLYAVTDDEEVAFTENYNAAYIRVDLHQDKLPIDTAFRVVGIYKEVSGVFNIDGVSYPEGDDPTYEVTNPGTLILVDYRRPVTRAIDQTEIFELVIPF